ncbi:MAG: hypothetical protein M1819_003586 [Sarea resinae]|nr:MAG: hypothetical protein M1819_003586 [Sarea resinae]
MTLPKGWVQDAAQYENIDKVMEFLSFPPANYHDPALKQYEEEILAVHKKWLHYWNHESLADAPNGLKGCRDYYNADQTVSFDMFGNSTRGQFGSHFDEIFPYIADGKMAWKDLEVTACSPTFGFSHMYQHTWGTAADGKKFDTSFRLTDVLKKTDGKWQVVHEHVSFPINMATQKADFTNTIDPKAAAEF